MSKKVQGMHENTLGLSPEDRVMKNTSVRIVSISPNMDRFVAEEDLERGDIVYQRVYTKGGIEIKRAKIE